MKVRSIWQYPVFHFAICIGLGLVLARFFHFLLLDRLTIYLWPLPWLSLFILVAVGMIWSIVFWIRCARAKVLVRSRMMPFMLQVSALVLMAIVPWEKYWLALNFYQHLGARQMVISLVQSYQITSGTNDIAALPAPYRQTAISHEIQIIRSRDGLHVLFFTMRVFDGAEGFIYSENPKPLLQDLFPGYEVIQRRAFDRHWHYVRILG